MKRIIKPPKIISSKKANGKSAITAALSAAIIFLSSAFIPQAGASFEKIGLISAGAQLPKGCEYIIKNEISNSAVNVIPKFDSGKTEKQNEQTKAPPAAPPAAQNDFTEIPDDIKKQIEAAQAKYDSASHDGKVVSSSYEKSGVTHSYNNVHVKNNTNQPLDIKTVLNEKPDLKIPDKSKPSVLIFHTHTTESYQMLDNGWYTKSYITRSNDSKTNMVRVGGEIEAQLKAAGFNVIHDRTIFDTSYNGSYERSGAAIDKYLKENPSIQVLLDIHRDGMKQSNGTGLKPTAEINGKKAAQLMIITGCEEGAVKNFPDWKYNLRFAMQLQKKCQDEFPGLMRPVYFSRRKYNMHKTRCSLLIEVGSEYNTLDEAAYSGRMLGKALGDLMDGYVG